MLADGFDHPSLGERLAHQEQLRKEAGHLMGTEPQTEIDVQEVRRRFRKQATAHLNGTAWRTPVEATDILALLDALEQAETELSSLREAVERHRYNLPHEYKLVDGHTPSAEGCRICAFLLAWDAAADPSPSAADPKGQS